MSSQAVPKLIQRFRSRELQRLVNKAGLRDPSERKKPVLNLKGVRESAKTTTLHNPFLPRPLFKRSEIVKPDASASVSADAAMRSGTDGGTSGTSSMAENSASIAGTSTNTLKKVRKGEETKATKWKERKKWAEARYSLRRQAVLVKLARKSGTLHLLPPGPKLSVKELEAAKRVAREKEKEKARVEAEKMETQTAEVETPRQKADQAAAEEARSVTARLTWRQHRRHVAAMGYPGVVFRWTGKAPQKPKKRLTIYTGRRRMFKGHKWERLLEKRRGQIAVRMRDMPKRIARFKNFYRRRQPNPLKPAVPRKRESLPF